MHTFDMVSGVIISFNKQGMNMTYMSCNIYSFEANMLIFGYVTGRRE